MKKIAAVVAAWALVSTVTLVAMKWLGVPGEAEVGHSWYYFLGGLLTGAAATPAYWWILENVE